jgi:hypothetical protein
MDQVVVQKQGSTTGLMPAEAKKKPETNLDKFNRGTLWVDLQKVILAIHLEAEKKCCCLSETFAARQGDQWFARRR